MYCLCRKFDDVKIKNSFSKNTERNTNGTRETAGVQQGVHSAAKRGREEMRSLKGSTTH